jgi:hypothetical protein
LKQHGYTVIGQNNENKFLYSITTASVAIQSVCAAPSSLNLTTGAGEQSAPLHTTLYFLEDSPIHIKKKDGMA